MLEINNLTAGYGKKTVLNNVSFKVPKNSITAVIGRNSSGKSTIISCINGQIKYSGSIKVDGTDLQNLTLRERAQKISVLSQFLTSPAFTVGQLVAFGRNPYIGLNGRMTDTDREIVASAIKSVGISNLEKRYVSSLSGGERQMAYLAMVLAQNTDLIVLDEPTSFMDISNESSFLKLLSEICRKEGKTVLIVMHNLTYAVNFADNIVVIDDGIVLYSGDKNECLQKNIIENNFDVKRYFAKSDEKIMEFFAAE